MKCAKIAHGYAMITRWQVGTIAAQGSHPIWSHRQASSSFAFFEASQNTNSSVLSTACYSDALVGKFANEWSPTVAVAAATMIVASIALVNMAKLNWIKLFLLAKRAQCIQNAGIDGGGRASTMLSAQIGKHKGRHCRWWCSVQGHHSLPRRLGILATIKSSILHAFIHDYFCYCHLIHVGCFKFLDGV